jgi:hypothetical protein
MNSNERFSIGELSKAAGVKVVTSASASPQAVSSHTALNSVAPQPNLTPMDKIALLRAQFGRRHRVSRSNSSTQSSQPKAQLYRLSRNCTKIVQSKSSVDDGESGN